LLLFSINVSPKSQPACLALSATQATRSKNYPQKDVRVGLDEVKDYWMRILSLHPQLFGIEKLADILEETGWFESNLQEAFGELQREGKVENLDAPRSRRTRFVHFEANRQNGERIQKVKS
jgi:hypothetical protein